MWMTRRTKCFSLSPCSFHSPHEGWGRTVQTESGAETLADGNHPQGRGLCAPAAGGTNTSLQPALDHRGWKSPQGRGLCAPAAGDTNTSLQPALEQRAELRTHGQAGLRTRAPRQAVPAPAQPHSPARAARAAAEQSSLRCRGPPVPLSAPGPPLGA